MESSQSVAGGLWMSDLGAVRTESGRRYLWAPLTVVVGIFVASTLLDLFYFTGFYSSDDISYFYLAQHILSHGRLPEDARFEVSFRLMPLGWNLLVMWMLGAHVQIIAASYVVFHQLVNALTYVVAARLFNRVVAVVGAYITALCPLLITFSTTIIPDVLLTCLFLLSFHAFMQAWDSADNARSTSSILAWMALAGASVGAAYMAKESGLILLPFYFVLWLVFSRGRGLWMSLSAGLMFALGLAGAFLVEWGILSHLTGRSFVRLNSAVETMDSASRTHIMRYGTNPLERLEWVGRRLDESFWYLPTSIALVLLAMVLLYPFFRKSRWPVLLLPLWVFAYQTWGSMRWREYFPPSIKARYYAPVMPFVAVIVAFVLVGLFARLKGRIRGRLAGRCLNWTACTLIIVLPLSGLRAADEDAGRKYRAEEVGGAMEAIRFAMNQGGDVPIVLSAYIWHRLQVFFLERRPERIIHSLNLDEEQIITMLDNGGFYFVDAPRRYRPGMPCSDLDALMHWFGGERVSRPDDTSTGLRASPVLSRAEAKVDGFAMRGYEGIVREIGWFHPQRRRSAEVRVLLGHGLVNEDDVEKPGSRAIWLCEVTARRRPVATDFHLEGGNVVEHDLAGDAAHWRCSYPKRFRSGGGTDAAPVFRRISREAGGLVWAFNLEKDAYVWLLPEMEETLERWTLSASGPHEFVLEAGMKGSVKAELRFDLFRDPERTELHSRKRIRLSGGAIRFSIQAAEAPLYIRPSFRISGAGEFSLDRFVVRSSAAQPG